jgi:Protein of unknown function (DUF1553)/Protein of unknown function (DUF1549)/Planctomycete cytochrome C
MQKTYITTIVVFLFMVLNSPAQELLRAPDFNKDIRPILSENCFQCHGPDEANRKAKLRLDNNDFLKRRSKNGKSLVAPKQPEESELYVRLITHEAGELMPPAKSGKALTKDQINSFKSWILQGAKWSEHWAFITPSQPPVPKVKYQSFIKNPIDNFIVHELEKRNLSPSSEASREVLLRRVTLDLTGLPPTPREIEDFLADKSANAYERVVDRLLNSSHYGERMAMQWLDYARYADSNGFQTDSSRSMWPWRDWVIEAFNRNMPFDQFSIQQIAGDLLPNPSSNPSQIIATGFNRNHRLNGEGGLIAEEWRIETVIDRVETTGLTWLGLTLGCARCHDHKYDPLSQKDFYQLFAFFNNIKESGTLSSNRNGGNSDPVINIPTVEQQHRLDSLGKEISELKKQKESAEKDLGPLVAKWEEKFKKELANNAPVWVTLNPSKVLAKHGSTLIAQNDGSYLASGKNPPHEIYEIEAPVHEGHISGIKLECLVDPSLPGKGAGRFSNSNFVLSKVEAEIVTPGKAPMPVNFSRAEADYSQQGWNISNTLGQDISKGWAVDGPTRKENRKAMFIAATRTPIPSGSTLKIRLVQQSLNQHNIGRFRLSFSSRPPEQLKLQGNGVPTEILEAFSVTDSKRTQKQKDSLIAYFKASSDSPLKQFENKMESLKKEIASLEAKIPTVMVMQEGQPRDAFILIRGQYDQKGEKVTAEFPRVFQNVEMKFEKNRLGFANWIVSPNNPLTARVWVNRSWEKFFGTGIVKTTDNLGSQSEYPIHRELLDWLATEFIRKNWDMKALQKLVVMSSTYRQSSKVTPQLMEMDPENKLLARGPRFRLQSELIRDQALAISGLLSSKIGGPSVRPYMPDGVWDETSRYGDLRNYKRETGENLYRRSMYTIWKRTAAPPSMLIFDSPNREICSITRSRTNTPLQALALLNEVTYVEAARKLGERMLQEGGKNDYERINHGLLLARGRKGSDQEINLLLEGLKKDIKQFELSPDSAIQLLSVGDYKSVNTHLDPKTLAAYTVTANILLNLDEVVTRE